ncbi:DNA replication and repair protein RecF [Treponema sp. J25]|uniref:DNA replication/repair protein RecF n=1 Tax=Treponema sp. J25 TaxID=2094121 RepID=UPI0010462F2E|nr:DNA replication and repair protein RecF [Treponema sp. J25]TCW61734.1 DNA replication and repair protein RecF [Treponema sp. J25]
MFIRNVRVFSFRNLVNQEVDVEKKDVFLVGENGQGKTNFLESLYCCAYGSSFRRCKDQEMIKRGENTCGVAVAIEQGRCSTISVKLIQGKKIIEVDGKILSHRRDLIQFLPVIIFCHEDMAFIKGTPEQRRWFFDQVISLWDPLYLDTLQRYKQVLKNRNWLLRNQDTRTLDAIDFQFVQYGLILIEKRQKAVERFSQVFSELFYKVAGLEGIQIQYRSSWKEGDQNIILRNLELIRNKELDFGVSLSGPHRDRYLFVRNSESFSEYASTGQVRLLSLLLRIAQAREFTEKTGQLPILLLDDVLLELDPEKRKKIASVLPAYEQAFYTFLPEEPYDRYAKGEILVYTVRDGVLERKA